MSVLAAMTEKHWQWQVLQAARLYGWTAYHTFDSRRSAYGFPDLVLVRPPRVLFVELKSATGRLSAVQWFWQQALRQCPGVEYHLWRPADRDAALAILAGDAGE